MTFYGMRDEQWAVVLGSCFTRPQSLLEALNAKQAWLQVHGALPGPVECSLYPKDWGMVNDLKRLSEYLRCVDSRGYQA